MAWPDYRVVLARATGNWARHFKFLVYFGGLKRSPMSHRLCGSTFLKKRFPQYKSDEACNAQTCVNGEQAAGQVNEFGIERSYSHHKINSFQQDCLDFHNFFRALHNLSPVRWDPGKFQALQRPQQPNYIMLISVYQFSDLLETAKLWSKKLIEVAPESPAKVSVWG